MGVSGAGGVTPVLKHAPVGVDLAHGHAHAGGGVPRSLRSVRRNGLLERGSNGWGSAAQVAVVMETHWEAVLSLQTLYLSSVAEGEILPTEVSDDPRRQGVAQHVDHGPEPVAMETETSAQCSGLSKGGKIQNFKINGF